MPITTLAYMLIFASLGLFTSSNLWAEHWVHELRLELRKSFSVIFIQQVCARYYSRCLGQIIQYNRPPQKKSLTSWGLFTYNMFLYENTGRFLYLLASYSFPCIFAFEMQLFVFYGKPSDSLHRESYATGWLFKQDGLWQASLEIWVWDAFLCLYSVTCLSFQAGLCHWSWNAIAIPTQVCISHA